jgi:hypothetical protein
MSKLAELGDELKVVLGGRISGILDVSLPPLFFLFGDWLCCPDLGLRLAFLTSVFMALLRLWRQEPIWAALGGLGLAGFAGLLAFWRVNSLAYFLPGMLSGAIAVFLCLLSLALRRPLVAWTSYLARNWPLAWYWYPQVRPAYAEVTAGWALMLSLRAVLLYQFFSSGQSRALALSQVVLGWPLILLLLAASYLYGQWRLRRLGGPSVAEYEAGKAAPWQGQQQGF